MLISQSRDEISLSIFCKKKIVFVSDRYVVRPEKMNFDLKIAD